MAICVRSRMCRSSVSGVARLMPSGGECDAAIPPFPAQLQKRRCDSCDSCDKDNAPILTGRGCRDTRRAGDQCCNSPNAGVVAIVAVVAIREARSPYKVSAHRPPPVGVAETGTERARDSTDLAERGHFSRSTLAHADRENILARLAGLPPAIDSHGRRLLEYTCAFLQSDHWETAITKGWEMVELFGIHPYAPLVHVGCQGLVTGVALSVFPGAKVVEIADDHAVIRNRSGSTLTFRRFMPAMEAAVLWWECPELVNWVGEL